MDENAQPLAALSAAQGIRMREIAKLRELQRGELEVADALEEPDLAATRIETLCAWLPSGFRTIPRRPPHRDRRDRASLYLFQRKIFGRLRVRDLNLVQRERVIEIAEEMRGFG